MVRLYCQIVMAGLAPAIHVFDLAKVEDVDARHRRVKRRRFANGYAQA
jgi:hypothetical protein